MQSRRREPASLAAWHGSPASQSVVTAALKLIITVIVLVRPAHFRSIRVSTPNGIEPSSEPVSRQDGNIAMLGSTQKLLAKPRLHRARGKPTAAPLGPATLRIQPDSSASSYHPALARDRCTARAYRGIAATHQASSSRPQQQRSERAGRTRCDRKARTDGSSKMPGSLGPLACCRRRRSWAARPGFSHWHRL